MSLVPFKQLMEEAGDGGYAVGYFESWNLESLLAVADAATSARSPVLLGFSGIYLPSTESGVKERLAPYAAFGTEVCRQLPVPACLVFNESPYFDWVQQAIDLRFGLVMFTDENLGPEAQQQRVRETVEKAHRASVAVEGEIKALPGVSGALSDVPEDLRLTDPEKARAFVELTGVDALAVNIGQAHVHGRSVVRLNLSRLAALRKEVPVPLVLHGGTSIYRRDLLEAIRLGVRKINIGSVLKTSYFEAVRNACRKVDSEYNPYEVVGSGLEKDVLAAGRAALKKTVEDLMLLAGSAGKA
jgi:fructose/tagatose bisphosphate aldolase